VYLGAVPAGSVRPSWSWFNPLEITSPLSFVEAILLMVFIYWGGDDGYRADQPGEHRRRALRRRGCSLRQRLDRHRAHPSAAASTQTTILPTARTTFAMAVFKALPDTFARVHPRYLTPTVSTVVMGAVSAALYIAFNFVSGGAAISDAVSAIGVSVGFYYGLTGLSARGCSGTPC